MAHSDSHNPAAGSSAGMIVWLTATLTILPQARVLGSRLLRDVACHRGTPPYVAGVGCIQGASPSGHRCNRALRPKTSRPQNIFGENQKSFDETVPVQARIAICDSRVVEAPPLVPYRTSGKASSPATISPSTHFVASHVSGFAPLRSPCLAIAAGRAHCSKQNRMVSKMIETCSTQEQNGATFENTSFAKCSWVTYILECDNVSPCGGRWEWRLVCACRSAIMYGRAQVRTIEARVAVGA